MASIADREAIAMTYIGTKACSECGRSDPRGGLIVLAGDLFPVCQNRIDCRITMRASAHAPDKLLRKSGAPQLDLGGPS